MSHKIVIEQNRICDFTMILRSFHKIFVALNVDEYDHGHYGS